MFNWFTQGGGGTSPATSFTDTYRTECGNYFFTFRFQQVGDHYEIDIVEMPSYGAQDTDPHRIHRISSSRGGYRICFGDESVVSSPAEARKWAKAWAELTMNYIRSGIHFPNT